MSEVPLHIMQRGESTCGSDAANDLGRDGGDCVDHRTRDPGCHQPETPHPATRTIHGTPGRASGSIHMSIRLVIMSI